MLSLVFGFLFVEVSYYGTTLQFLAREAKGGSQNSPFCPKRVAALASLDESVRS
jgi:hypothetical protein